MQIRKLTFTLHWIIICGMKVNKKEIIQNLIEENGGIVKISDFVKAGISRQYAIPYLKEQGCERVAKGIYLSPEAWQDDLYVLYLQYKKVVFSHDTALYLLEMAEREPSIFSVTVPRGYKVDFKGSKPIKVYSTKEDWHLMRIEMMLTPYGHKVPCYSAEQTLCDIFRCSAEVQERKYAMQEYLKSKKNLLLMEYAAVFHVEKKIRQYTEALL